MYVHLLHQIITSSFNQLKLNTMVAYKESHKAKDVCRSPEYYWDIDGDEDVTLIWYVGNTSIYADEVQYKGKTIHRN